MIKICENKNPNKITETLTFMNTNIEQKINFKKLKKKVYVEDFI